MGLGDANIPGTTGIDDNFAARGFDGVGAWILGRNMFGPVRGPWPDDSWKGWWGESPPFQRPVFVLTHHARTSLTMQGGTTFHFVTGGIREAYERAMQAKGNTTDHTKQALKNIRFAAKIAEWKTIADIDHASLDLSIDRLRSAKKSHATINHHIRSAKAFSRWLLSNHRLARDPLVGVKLLNVAADRRRERRALDDDELAALLRVAAEVPSVTVEHRYIRKAGPNKGDLRRGTRTFTIERRDLLYLLAASTGLRFSEIKSLTPASFDFVSDPKTVTVEASYSKRRRRDVQPMRHDIAEAMRPFVEAAPKREPLWPKLPDEIARVMAKDLEVAGVPVTDEAGRVADFHALRHTFITRLARSGVTPKVAQALARHSTITLTMDRYAHVALADTSKALASLPALPVTAAQPAALAATGTHGRDNNPSRQRR